VLERGTLADSIRKYPRHKLLFAEPLSIPLYGDLWISDASKETLLEVWQTIISNTGLDVRVQHEVRNIRRDDDRFVVETAAGPLRARRVVLAMGRRGTPRRLEVPGEELGKVFYDIVEMEAFQGSRVLVVGGGDSAIESAVGLANQPGTAVTLSYRGAHFERAKERNRAKLDDAVAHGRLRLVLESRVRAIREDVVELEHGGTCHRLPNDYVILRLGGEPPFAFLERLGVRIVKKDLPLAGSSEAAVA
jgi:thioredoxin reductase